MKKITHSNPTPDRARQRLTPGNRQPLTHNSNH